MGNTHLNPWKQAKVDPKNPDRRPLLVIEGAKGPTRSRGRLRMPAYKRQKRNPGMTGIVRIPNRGQPLIIDHGWREVAV
jgi:hypothetical protein